MSSPEMAYAVSMQGNPYAMRGMQQVQQQQQQQYGINAPNSMQQPYGLNATNVALQQQQANAYVQQQGRQPLQATPDRLGITPMQLAMLQQQRMQQNRSPQLVRVPSIHSVASSARSWADDQQ